MSKFASVDNKFATSFDVVEEELRSSTIGKETPLSLRSHLEHIIILTLPKGITSQCV